MKILYVANSDIPSKTANSVQVMKMCDAFATNGHEVRLITKATHSKDSPGTIERTYGVRHNFPIHRYPHIHSRSSRVLHAGAWAIELAYIMWLMAKWKPDLVYGRNIRGCQASAMMGIPFIFETHNTLVRDSHISRMTADTVMRSPQMKRIVVQSSALKAKLLKAETIKKGLILAAHDGAEALSIDTLPKRWPGRKGTMQVGYIGNLYEGRGIGIIVHLAQTMADVDFHIVGGTREEAATRNITIPDNLFFHGFVPHSTIHTYRNACDVLVAPYQKKVRVAGNQGNTADIMSPLKLFEYMASRKAIVVSDFPVLREILDDSMAILVPSGDKEAWKNAIASLKDANKRMRLANNAYESLLKNYTWEQRAREVLGNIAIGDGS